MRLLLRTVLSAGFLASLLAPLASGQGELPEMYAYQDLYQSGGTVFGYAATDIAYPMPANQCPYWGGGNNCWEEYSSYAQVDLYLDNNWLNGYWYEQPDGWAEAWVYEDAAAGGWALEATHEVDDLYYLDAYGFEWYEAVMYDHQWRNLSINAPSINGIDPSAKPRGTTGAAVQISGDNFGQSPEIIVEGNGVSMSVSYAGQGYIEASVTVESDAESGDHEVKVRAGGLESNAAVFTVQDPTPAVTSISPGVWGAGWTDHPITIYGSAFGNSPTVDAGPYVSVYVSSSNGTEIDATITVDPGAPDTQQEVVVTSHGWGGQGFVPAPQAEETGNGTVTLSSAPAGCAVPIDFRKVGNKSCRESDARLTINYTWDSSTGNRPDLAGCTIREVVWYDNAGTPPSPPFPETPFDDPTVISGDARSEGFIDNHSPPTGDFVKPYSVADFKGLQTYQYQCSCQGTEEWTDFSNHRRVEIKRSVTHAGGVWNYVITKLGDSCERRLPD